MSEAIPLIGIIGGWVLGGWGLWRLRSCNSNGQGIAAVAAIIGGYFLACGSGIWLGSRFL